MENIPGTKEIMKPVVKAVVQPVVQATITNPWISHVKSYAEKNGVSYAVALKESKASYTRPTKPKAKRGRKPMKKEVVAPENQEPNDS